jgi:sulfoxide reductase catalytic subunit YedY
MNVKSVIGYPQNGTIVNHNSHVVVRGVAFDNGQGIQTVLISLDKGKSWKEALLDKDPGGRYGFRAFRFAFQPAQYGKQSIMAKAINRSGIAQPFAEDIGWNHGGYQYNGIDVVTVEVV